MKPAIPLLCVLLITAFFTACGSGTNTGTEHAPAPPSPGHVVSPLAQLMRDMTLFADSTKHRLLRGEDLLPYPSAFKDMITAESTPGMVDHRTYDPFAFSYLHQLDTLYKVPVEQRQAAYDELIAHCTACHGQVCPGPLVRINKLKLPDSVH